MDVTFKLNPQDLVNYRYAVRDRLQAVPAAGFLQKRWVRAMMITGASAALFVIIDAIIPVMTGRQLAGAELGAGFAIGIMFLLGLLWLQYFDQSRVLVRPDGPTLSEHTVVVNTSGLHVTAPHMMAHYSWPAIQDVTTDRDLVLFWLEPSFGLAVPQHAFQSTVARDAFIAAVKARRTESDLPRAGSFGAS